MKTDYKLGDVVKVEGYGDALWEITELGERTYYSNGDVCSIAPDQVTLYLPEPHLPSSFYPAGLPANCEWFEPVAEMQVIAMSARQAPRTPVKELLLEQKLRRRLKKKKRLKKRATRFGASPRDKSLYDLFRKQNPDLFYLETAKWNRPYRAPGA